MPGFQTAVPYAYAPGVDGDFASVNPHRSVIALDGGLVAGAGGVTVGRFGWVQADGLTILNAGSGKPSGFIGRKDSHGLVTAYLGTDTLLVPAGFDITAYESGDFWARTTTAATRGQKIFASTTTGAVQTGAAGATIAGYVETDWFAAITCLANEIVVISRTPVY